MAELNMQQQDYGNNTAALGQPSGGGYRTGSVIDQYHKDAE